MSTGPVHHLAIAAGSIITRGPYYYSHFWNSCTIQIITKQYENYLFFSPPIFLFGYAIFSLQEFEKEILSLFFNI